MSEARERYGPPRERDERGQVTVLIIGFAFVLALAVAVVVDASAAYLQRQGLDTLADGAALRGADLGATGQDVYAGGVGEGPLELTPAQANAAVRRYLADVGAYRRYPGLAYDVRIEPATDSVVVRLRAPLDLPLTVPGSAERPTVSSTGSARVDPDRLPDLT